MTAVVAATGSQSMRGPGFSGQAGLRPGGRAETKKAGQWPAFLFAL